MSISTSLGADHPPYDAGARAVLVTGDPLLRQEAQRLAAAAGCPLDPCDDLARLRREWRRGRAVLVGAELLAELRAAGLPRREDVHVLAAAPMGGEALRDALELGVRSVWELPGDAARLAALLGDLGDDDVAPGAVVGVVGASGGVGASVLTLALGSVASGAAGSALAVDLDDRGAGLEVLAGVPSDPSPTWETLAAARGRLNAPALRAALTGAHGPGVLGWGATGRRLPPPPGVVGEALSAARRGHEWTFVDTRSPDVWSSCDALVLLVAASVHGVGAAVRLADSLPSGVPTGVAVRSRRHDRWAEDVARSLARPLWTVVTDQRALDTHLSAGLGPVRRRRSALRRASYDILLALSAR